MQSSLIFLGLGMLLFLPNGLWSLEDEFVVSLLVSNRFREQLLLYVKTSSLKCQPSRFWSSLLTRQRQSLSKSSNLRILKAKLSTGVTVRTMNSWTIQSAFQLPLKQDILVTWRLQPRFEILNDLNTWLFIVSQQLCDHWTAFHGRIQRVKKQPLSIWSAWHPCHEPTLRFPILLFDTPLLVLTRKRPPRHLLFVQEEHNLWWLTSNFQSWTADRRVTAIWRTSVISSLFLWLLHQQDSQWHCRWCQSWRC